MMKAYAENALLEKSSEEFYSYFKEKGLTSYAVRKFRKTVYFFYEQYARNDLPWRNTVSPYHIFISEIMLQQTQIERVLKKYPLFIKKFPDFSSLAQAQLRSLYAVWQGMGYNRRALALKNIARAIMDDPYNGKLPSDPAELMRLPFVGQSTAGAVAAFAFGKPAVFIETNIRRVFINFFFREKDSVSDHEIIPLIEKTCDRKDPRNWYYGLMDYGSALRRLTENPNRKSAAYKKQKSFQGSNRQIRGRILRLLLERNSMALDEMSETLMLPNERIAENLDQLQREELIKKHRKKYRMP
jgi:A/G-specific adenine glycosylase